MVTKISKKDVKKVNKIIYKYFKRLRKSGISVWRAGKMSGLLASWYWSNISKK